MIRDPRGELDTQALLCTNPAVAPAQMVEWFVLRRQLEATFQEVRAHLGVEIQRQWSDRAIARTTPILMGLFSWVALAAHAFQKRRPIIQRTAAWYAKPAPTFVDAIALVHCMPVSSTHLPTPLERTNSNFVCGPLVTGDRRRVSGLQSKRNESKLTVAVPRLKRRNAGMDTQSTFDFDEPKQASAMNETEIDAIDADAGNVPEQKNIDDISSSGESQKSDGAEIAAPDPQGSNEPDGEAIGANEQVSIRTETSSIYEATGLIGHFELSAEALVFPHTSDEDLALARNIEANGMLEEITLAGDPPKVVDGKRRLRACKVAGVEPTYRLLRQDIDPRAYVWAKNAERRDLSTSQKALAFALLYPKLGPGRPPGPAGKLSNV